MKKILIVGGVAGGASAAARLRRLNKEDKIIMYEKVLMYLFQIVRFHII